MPNTTDPFPKQIEDWTKEYATKSEAEIRSLIARIPTASAQYIAGDMALTKLASERDPTPRLLESLDSRVSRIEQVATRSEFRTWSLWFSFIAVIVAFLALFRDYFGWSSLAPKPVVTHPSAAAGLSPDRPQPHSLLTTSQPAAAVGTASVQRAVGSTSTPPRLPPP